MINERELYILEREFPNNFAKLGNKNASGNYSMKTIRLDEHPELLLCNVLVSDSKEDPIVFIENQNKKKKNFYLHYNVKVSNYCLQEFYYNKYVKVAIFFTEEQKNYVEIPMYEGIFEIYTLSDKFIKHAKKLNDIVLMCLKPLCLESKYKTEEEEEVKTFFKDWSSLLEKANLSYSKINLLKGIYTYFFAKTFEKSIEEVEESFGVDIMDNELVKKMEKR